MGNAASCASNRLSRPSRRYPRSSVHRSPRNRSPEASSSHFVASKHRQTRRGNSRHNTPRSKPGARGPTSPRHRHPELAGKDHPRPPREQGGHDPEVTAPTGRHAQEPRLKDLTKPTDDEANRPKYKRSETVTQKDCGTSSEPQPRGSHRKPRRENKSLPKETPSADNTSKKSRSLGLTTPRGNGKSAKLEKTSPANKQTVPTSLRKSNTKQRHQPQPPPLT
ncbi:MAG: hypothetical protein M1816_004901 [Peltula sp. TS41687]|nr:MAG: hypothetical protein M1816_004901 [Peltula sp. TS41687]